MFDSARETWLICLAAVLCRERLDQVVTKGKKVVLVGQADLDQRVAVVLRVRLGRLDPLDQLEVPVSQ